eukprot:IDg22521t1
MHYSTFLQQLHLSFFEHYRSAKYDPCAINFHVSNVQWQGVPDAHPESLICMYKDFCHDNSRCNYCTATLRARDIPKTKFKSLGLFLMGKLSRFTGSVRIGLPPIRAGMHETAGLLAARVAWAVYRALVRSAGSMSLSLPRRAIRRYSVISTLSLWMHVLRAIPLEGYQLVRYMERIVRHVLSR